MAVDAPKRDHRLPSAGDLQIGARVRARRMELQISQQMLAKSIGVTFQQIQKYERGANRIAVVTLIEIAQALDIGVDALLGFPQHMTTTNLLIDEPGFAPLAIAYRDLNAAGRTLLIATAKAFLAQTILRERK